MSVLGDIWNRVTGKKAEPEQLSPQQKFEEQLAKELTRQQEEKLGISPEQKQYRAQVEQVKQDARAEAARIGEPGPAERMTSYKDLFTERSRQALKQEREARVTAEKSIADGTAPTPIDRKITRLPERSSGPDR